MGWFDWLRGKPAGGKGQDAGQAAKPAAKGRDLYTGTAGATVEAGDGQHGTYAVDDTVVARGSAAVLDFVLKDEMLEEVMHNGSDRPLVVFHRSHGMCDVNHRLDPRLVEAFIKHVATINDKVLDDQHPFLDGTLEDGSRINVAIPPVSGQYPNFTIRKFRKGTITVPDLIRFGAVSAEAASFLWCAQEGFGHAAANLLVVGGTGSGKTTLLNAMAWFAPMHHRMVVIEDTRELKIPQPNALRMATSETVSMDDLLINALRQRPDRILVGEVRGPEAKTLFTAMNTGHDGCMGTVHANSARESVLRITAPPMNVPATQVAALDLIVVQQRKTTSSGTRRFCSEITEVSGFGGDTARLNQLFLWDEFQKRVVYTEVPSRLRTKICQAAGMTAEEFKAGWDRRRDILQRLADAKAPEEDVMRAFGQEVARGK